MKTGVAGAGAVGCHYGFLLQQAGFDVNFFGRGNHLAAMREHGLVHVSGGCKTRLSVCAGDNPSILASCDLILLCCKITDLPRMLADIGPHLPARACLVTLQNGVQAPGRAAGSFPGHDIIAGTAFIGARIEQPGMVVHSAAGGVRLGGWPPGHRTYVLDELLAAFNSAGVPAREDEDVLSMLWRKLLWNCGFNAITALTRRYARQIAADEATRQVSVEAMHETLAVAGAEGIALSGEDIDKHIKVTLEMGPVKTSMWQDIEAGRRTEVDFINGHVAELGDRHGIPTPVNRLLTVLIHTLEQGAR